MATINGWPWDDVGVVWMLTGTDEADFIFGHEGNDWLFGYEGNDTLDGGTGADFMDGDIGNDTYIVDNVNDRVAEFIDEDDPAGGIDLVLASVTFTLPDRGDDVAPGSDVFSPGDNRIENLTLVEAGGAIDGTGNVYGNEIRGNSFDNTLEGLDGDDRLFGNGGDDELRGGRGADVLDGGTGDDQLFGGQGYDILMGGLDNDVLDGGEEMFGGGGDDTYFVRTAGAIVSEFLGSGYDEAFAIVTATVGNNVETLVLVEGAGAIDGFAGDTDNMIIGNASDNELRGNGGEDLLKGGGGADDLRGGAQNDELYGEAGDDELRGELGDDDMYGGLDDDLYTVNSAGDEVYESPGEGIDTVTIMAGLNDYTLTADVENLNVYLNGTGNGLGNTIIGNVLDNNIDGAGGVDRMEGREGNDTYTVNLAGDQVIELANQGTDTVRASTSYTLAATTSVESLTTTNETGTGAINLTGNNINNGITGNNGVNILNGRGGSDVLDGRGGFDTASYVDNAARVVVFLGANGAPGQGLELNAQDAVVSVDTLLNIEEARGSNFDDTLVGVAVDHVLRGGAGNDTYFVHDGGVDVLETTNQGIDEVRTSVSFNLTAGQAIERLRTTDDEGETPINLTGNSAANRITGNDGDNRIDGGFGILASDELIGRDGNDIYIIRTPNDFIDEDASLGNDTVLAFVSYELSAGADVEFLRTINENGTGAIDLTGNSAGNSIFGNNGDNTLNGGGGRDDLTGNGGRDEFLFDTPLVSTEFNVGSILDFTRGTDVILLENTAFGAFAAGPLADDRFVLGTAALDANDNILYDQATGALFYDSDGSGKSAPIQFAAVTAGLALSHEDFFII